MSAWLFVLGDRDAKEWVIANKTMAFRDHIRATGLVNGDRFVLYTTRGCYNNPTRDHSQVIGTGTITSNLRRDPVAINGETFTQSVTLKFDTEPLDRGEGLDFVSLVPELGFIRKKKSWMAYVRKALVPLPDEDFERVAARLAEHRATNLSSST